MAKSPYISSNGRCLTIRELRSAHRRHRASVHLRFCYTCRDDFENSLEAAITPQIFWFREIGSKRRACAVCTMTPRAGGSANPPVVNAIPQCNHLRRRALGNRHVCRIAFGWLGSGLNNLAGRSREAWAWRRLWRRPGRVAHVGDSIDPSANVVRHIQGAVRPDSQP